MPRSFTRQGDYSAIKVVSVLTKFLKKLEKKFFEQIKIILARLWRNNSQRFSLKSRSGNALPVCSRRGRGTPPSRFWPRPPPSWPDSYNLSHSVAIVRFLRCHFFERERKKNFFQVKNFYWKPKLDLFLLENDFCLGTLNQDFYWLIQPHFNTTTFYSRLLFSLLPWLATTY